VRLSNVVDQLHDHNGLSDTGATEKPDLSAIGIWFDQIDDLKASQITSEEHAANARLRVHRRQCETSGLKQSTGVRNRDEWRHVLRDASSTLKIREYECRTHLSDSMPRPRPTSALRACPEPEPKSTTSLNVYE